MSLEKSEEITTTKSKKKPNKGPYLLGEALGEGAFAKVRLATQIHIKEKCAIKIVDKRLLEDTKDIQRLKKEIKIFKNIRHKNIIQLFDIMESKTNLYFVMEYCKGGELFDYIVKNKRLKENEACVFFQQIINGVEYLHKQGIIHRDLKPENLLLDYNNNIKISDFGLSTFFSKNHYLQTACGTPSYAPPEMLEGLQYNGEASDIWSCGIILYAMLCGTLPFTESKEEIIVKKIKMHDYSIPNYLSEEAQDMLNHILKINPEERFTIEGIKKHPWFNLVKPHLIKGISLNEIKIPVDENILNMVKDYGFDKEECRNLLLNNKFCCLTSIYYLCLKKYIREGGKSISDLESDLYEEYINNPNNYINQNNNENININKDTKKEKEKEKEKNTNKNNNNNNIENNNNIKNNNNIVLKEKNINLKNQEKNGVNNIEEIKIKEFNNKNIKKYNNENMNMNNDDKKINNHKQTNIDKSITVNNNKTTNINNNNNNNNNNKKKNNININKKDQKSCSSKNNQSITIQKKLKEANPNKNTKKIIISNNYNNITKQNKYIKNNILIQDKKPKIENSKNQPQQIIIKSNETKMNSPSRRKNTTTTNNNNEPHNFNTIIIKKKLVNKVQNNPQKKKLNINEKKSPKRYIEDNNMKSNSLMNSFNTKNKSLEHEIHNNLSLNKDENSKMNNNINNKFEKINIKDNIKEKKIIIDNHKEKNITHSNTVTGSNINNKIINMKNITDNKNTLINNNNNNLVLNNDNNKEEKNINKIIFAFGINPDNEAAVNILYEQGKAKEAYQNYRNILREGKADARNKSSPFPLEQFGLDKDIDESKFMEGQKPLNVINYIAKKLVSSSFCGSFNFQYASAKKYSTARRSSAITHNHLISNGNLFVNKESNPINEEIEYMKENSNTSNNGSNNGNYNDENNIKDNNNKNDINGNKNYDDNINDINFKNLISILNQKFKKYLAKNKTDFNIKNNENIKEVDNLNNYNSNTVTNNNYESKNKKGNYNVINHSKNKKVNSLNNSNKNNNIVISNISKNKLSKNIDYKEDLYSNSFTNKKYKNDFITPNNLETYAYNINDMTSHYNKFLDISTNYDPGIDSRGGSSIERGDSINKNELRNFSFSLDKKHKKSMDHKFKTEYNEKNEGNNYNVIKNTFSGSQNKFNKNINIISENEELNQNTMKKIKYNKSIKNKYCPFLEKKVSINLSNTFNNLSKTENKHKKK